MTQQGNVFTHVNEAFLPYYNPDESSFDFSMGREGKALSNQQ